ncbi:MAG: DUF4383 domain-containing protein [Actinomycetota bacterium]|nr:DUF4383 domain-containing protein [Actinomycetota bacterium]
METAISRIAAGVGVVYVLVGLAGFVVTGAGNLTGHGSHLLVFQVNPLHNIAHLALGALLLVGASRGATAARQAMVAVGLVFLLLGGIGPAIAGTPADLVALNGADHLLHGVTAVVLILSGPVLGRRLQPAV